MNSIGLETELSKIGINENSIQIILDNINFERLKNNPRKLNQEDLKEILKGIL